MFFILLLILITFIYDIDARGNYICLFTDNNCHNYGTTYECDKCQAVGDLNVNYGEFEAYNFKFGWLNQQIIGWNDAACTSNPFYYSLNGPGCFPLSMTTTRGIFNSYKFSTVVCS